MFLQTNHSTAGAGCPLVMHTTDWPVAEPWWMSIRSTMTAGTGTAPRRINTAVMGVKLANGSGIFPSLTFDLQEQSNAATVIAIFHAQGVVSAVLLLGSDEGENASVAVRSDKTGHCSDRTTLVTGSAAIGRPPLGASPGLAELPQAGGDLGGHVAERDAVFEPSDVSAGEGADFRPELADFVQLG